MNFSELIQCKSLFFGVKSISESDLDDLYFGVKKIAKGDLEKQGFQFFINQDGRVHVSCGDWAEKETMDIVKNDILKLPGINGNEKLFRMEAESGPPRKEEGWEHISYDGKRTKVKHIEKSGSGYDLRAKHGSHHVLGHHATREGAIKQEEAIEMSKHAHGKSIMDPRLINDTTFQRLLRNEQGGLGGMGPGGRKSSDELEIIADRAEELGVTEAAERYRSLAKIRREQENKGKALSAYQSGNGAELVGATLPKRRFAKSILEARSRRAT